MNYQGGSMFAGNDLEKLHEFKVKNYYNRAVVKKQEIVLEEKKSEIKEETTSEVALDQTFNSDSYQGQVESAENYPQQYPG